MTNTATLIGAPSSKEEAWRYTPVKDIATRVQNATSARRSSISSITKPEFDSLIGNLSGTQLVFVNGFYNEELSNTENLPDGLYCGLASENSSVSKELVLLNENVRTVEGICKQNDEYDIAVVKTDNDIILDDPIHIVHIATNGIDENNSQIISHPRTIIELGDNSHIAIVETYCGNENNTMTDACTTIRIGDNTKLDQIRIQNESSSATHIGNTRIEQGKDSHVKMASITKGADIARNAIDAHLDSENSVIELTGVNITSIKQVHDTEVTVDHASSNCASNQHFVGVVDDHGHSSFSGEIIVEHGTVGTDAHQTNKNLVLDEHAQADTRPWLRIYADDVQCTHGSTVGRLDEESLFYLRSRGIENDKARTMLIEAFIAQITDEIENDKVRSHVATLTQHLHPFVQQEIKRKINE